MKKTFFRFLFTSIVTSMGCCANAQTKFIDSIKQLITTNTTDKEQLEQITALAVQSINPDSLLRYVLIAENIISKTKNQFDIDKVATVRASYYVRKNYIDSALNLVNGLIPIYKTDKEYQYYYLSLLFLKSKILDMANRYTQALTQLYQVVETAETLKDTVTLIQAKTGYWLGTDGNGAIQRSATMVIQGVEYIRQ